MNMSFLGKEQTLLNAKLREVVQKCNIKKKLPKKVGQHRVPVNIKKKYKCLLVFSKPAKVVNIDFNELQVDVSMKTALVSVDGLFPENSGKATVRYKLSFELFSQTLQFRGASIAEISFANDMLPALKEGMKKKAGNLNLNLSVKECY